MALAERADLVARLSLKDEFSGKLRGAQKTLSGFDKATKNTQQSLGKMGQNLSRLATVGAVAFTGAVVGAVKVAGDFEASLNTINTIARTNAEGLTQIGDAIRKVARDTGTPLEQLTQGYYDLLSAGIKAADATDVLTAANKLAIGGLASTAETIDLLTTAINTYGGNAANAGKYADYFAKAVERGKVTAAEIAQSFAQVGSIAASSGIEIQELAAGYARLTAAGVPAAEAATQMRSAIVGLTRVTGPLEKLQKQTGRNYLALAGEKGLVAALEQLRKDAAKAGIPLIDLLGRVEGLNFALLTTGPNFDEYNADLAAMGTASGTAAQQMAERQQGLNFQLARLKALATDAGITIGSKLLPKIVPLVSKLNEFIGQNQDKIGQIGDKLAEAFENIAGVAGKIDWNSIGAGLAITGRAAKLVVDTFMALPPDLQKLAVAALALNKVGGGIVTSGIKDIAGLLLRGATGGGVGGVLGGLGVQKVFVVNMPVGGGIGGAGGVAATGGSFARTLGTGLAITAAATGVAMAIETYFEQKAGIATVSSGVQASNDAMLANSPSIDDMKQSLRGIDEGIDKIQSNPLNMILGGDALKTLQDMRGKTANQLGEVNRWMSMVSYGTGQVEAKLGTTNRNLDTLNNKRWQINNRIVLHVPVTNRTTTYRYTTTQYADSGTTSLSAKTGTDYRL